MTTCGPPTAAELLFDNGVYASTADIPTDADRIDLGEVARSVGAVEAVISDADNPIDATSRAFRQPGPQFLHVRIEPETTTIPRLLPDRVIIKDRFETWLHQARASVIRHGGTTNARS